MKRYGHLMTVPLTTSLRLFRKGDNVLKEKQKKRACFQLGKQAVFL